MKVQELIDKLNEIPIMYRDMELILFADNEGFNQYCEIRFEEPEKITVHFTDGY